MTEQKQTYAHVGLPGLKELFNGGSEERTMNITELYEMQKTLDERIIKEKGLEGQDLLPNTVLALQVEIGELANEWRGFKHWSNDRGPRTVSKVPCHVCRGFGGFIHENEPSEMCAYCEGTGLQEDRNPLLEEYVDCLHFILSIGLQTGFIINNLIHMPVIKNTTDQFLNMFSSVYYFLDNPKKETYRDVFSVFITLGKQLGFTEEQIYQAYIDKNKVNHERQANGY